MLLIIFYDSYQNESSFWGVGVGGDAEDSEDNISYFFSFNFNFIDCVACAHARTRARTHARPHARTHTQSMLRHEHSPHVWLKKKSITSRASLFLFGSGKGPTNMDAHWGAQICRKSKYFCRKNIERTTMQILECKYLHNFNIFYLTCVPLGPL